MIQQSKKMSAKARKRRVTDVLQRIVHTTLVQVLELSRDHTAEKKQIRNKIEQTANDLNKAREAYNAIYLKREKSLG